MAARAKSLVTFLVLSLIMSGCALLPTLEIPQSQPQSAPQSAPSAPKPKPNVNRPQSTTLKTDLSQSVTIQKANFIEAPASAEWTGDGLLGVDREGKDNFRFKAWTPSMNETVSCELRLVDPEGEVDKATFTLIHDNGPQIIAAYNLTRKGSGLKSDETVITYRFLDAKSCSFGKRFELPFSKVGVGESYNLSFMKASSKVAALSIGPSVIGLDLATGNIIWQMDSSYAFHAEPSPSWAISLTDLGDKWRNVVMELETGRVISESTDQRAFPGTLSYTWSKDRILLGIHPSRELHIKGFLSRDGSQQLFPEPVVVWEPRYSVTAAGQPSIIAYRSAEDLTLVRVDENGVVHELLSSELVEQLRLEIIAVCDDRLFVRTNRDFLELDLDGKETGRRWPQDTPVDFFWSTLVDGQLLTHWGTVISRNGKLPWVDR